MRALLPGEHRDRLGGTTPARATLHRTGAVTTPSAAVTKFGRNKADF